MKTDKERCMEEILYNLLSFHYLDRQALLLLPYSSRTIYASLQELTSLKLIQKKHLTFRDRETLSTGTYIYVKGKRKEETRRVELFKALTAFTLTMEGLSLILSRLQIPIGEEFISLFKSTPSYSLIEKHLRLSMMSLFLKESGARVKPLHLGTSIAEPGEIIEKCAQEKDGAEDGSAFGTALCGSIVTLSKEMKALVGGENLKRPQRSRDFFAAPFSGILETKEKVFFLYSPSLFSFTWNFNKDFQVFVPWVSRYGTYIKNPSLMERRMDGIVFFRDRHHLKNILEDPLKRRKRKNKEDPLGEKVRHLYAVPLKKEGVKMLKDLCQGLSAKETTHKKDKWNLERIMDPFFTYQRKTDGKVFIDLSPLDVKVLMGVKARWEKGDQSFGCLVRSWQMDLVRDLLPEDIEIIILEGGEDDEERYEKQPEGAGEEDSSGNDAFDDDDDEPLWMFRHG